MYIRRHAENTIKTLSKLFSVVLVTGARQVGKTTMLKQMYPDINHTTLDDTVSLQQAADYPVTFIKDNPPVTMIDEAQKATGIFPEIKKVVDELPEKGLYYLTGSQQFWLMKNVSESLSGRIGIVSLLPLSLREISGVDFNMPFLLSDEYLQRRKSTPNSIDYSDVWRKIQRGMMPAMELNADMDPRLYYNSYVKTYIERDIRDLAQVGDELKFMKFMTAVASRTGQLLNLSSLARDVSVSQPTAERWLSVLLGSNIVYLLQPYSNNILTRVVKTPKVYFLDTGLAAYLTKWTTPDALKDGAMAGKFFESFVISEIIKSYYNNGLEPNIYFYRDKEGKEIDCLIEDNGTLYPIEIKMHADPQKDDIKSFHILDRIPDIKRGRGGVICMYDNILSLTERDSVIPVKYL